MEWSICGIRLEWMRKTAKTLIQSMPGPRFETGRLTVQVEFFSFLNQRARLNISIPMFRILHNFVCHYCKHWRQIPSYFQKQFRHSVWDTPSLIFYIGIEPAGMWRWLFVVLYRRSTEWVELYRHSTVFLYAMHRDDFVTYIDIDADAWTRQSSSSGFLVAQ